MPQHTIKYSLNLLVLQLSCISDHISRVRAPYLHKEITFHIWRFACC